MLLFHESQGHWSEVTKNVSTVVGILAALVGGVFALWKYRKDQIRELNAFIFQKQADLYFEASKCAATIATSADPAVVDAAKARFDELYYGELVVVEDRRVELAMIAFDEGLKGNPDPRPREDKYGNEWSNGK